MVPDLCLKLSYSVFSVSELSGQLMSRRESMLVLCLGIIGRAVNQPQNGLGCQVNWIAIFWLGVRFWCQLNDRFCRS
jgi:hypothetical protein